MQIKTLSIPNGPRRLSAVAVCIIVAVLALLVTKWSFGHATAINASNIEVAELGAALAPSDPQAHLEYAYLLGKTFLPADQDRSLVEFEKAAALAPANYQTWLALGRAREQSGDAAGSEAALRKALELAPNYSRVQWALGNLLVRQGRYGDGFGYLRNAAASDPVFTNPAAASAWQILGGDTAKIRNLLGDSPRTNAALSVLLSADKRYADALDVWRAIPDAEKKGLKEPGQALYSKLLDAGLYRSAIEVGGTAGLFSDNAPATGAVSNGGFESAITPNDPNPFTWAITEGSYPRIGLNDAQKKSGSYSLLMNFGTGDKGSRPVIQKMGVETGATYDLRFYYRSELRTDAKVVCRITSAVDANPIATVPVTSSGDWTEAGTTFAVPAGTEGIELKLSVEGCPANGCSIAGNIWFDDFSLTKR
ncbi:MAG: hypothetical protein HOP17_13425 [Acidobacteria bacterium]|nr:hypothetical protein [Acidobacteriota bacterium]